MYRKSLTSFFLKEKKITEYYDQNSGVINMCSTIESAPFITYDFDCTSNEQIYTIRSCIHSNNY